MLFSKQDEFEVAAIEDNRRVVATQTPMRFLEVSQKKREGKHCLFVYFVFCLYPRMEEGEERKRRERKILLVLRNLINIYNFILIKV